jgi:ankyrin repeat protein
MENVDWQREAAVERDDVSGARKLLSAGSDPNAVDSVAGRPIVERSIDSANDEMVRLFVHFGAAIDRVDADGRTAVARAASSVDDSPSLRVVLAVGVNVEASDRNGWRPIHFAAVHGYVRNVELLIAAGADPGAVTAHGLTARALAERNGHHVIAGHLPTP